MFPGNKRLVAASKLLAKEAGADLDVSGVWTFIDNSSSVANQSGQLSNSTKLLSQHNIPMNSMGGGGTSMLAMLQMSHPNLDRSNLPGALVACPKKKPRPLMGAQGAAAYHHQRSKSQDPDSFLQQTRPLHQRSRSQDPDRALVLCQTYGSQQHFMQQQNQNLKQSHPSLMLHSTPVQQQKQKVITVHYYFMCKNFLSLIIL